MAIKAAPGALVEVSHSSALEDAAQRARRELVQAFADREKEISTSWVLSPTVIERVATSDPSNIQEVAASQLSIISRIYENVLSQAQQSFRAALVAAAIGLVFLLAAIGFLLVQSRTDVATVSVIIGALVEVISGINFYLYAKTSQQLSSFHLRLDQTQRLLLANSVCENLEGDIKASTRAKLVHVIASGERAESAKENAAVKRSARRRGGTAE
jgi:hypothetical protein